MVGPGQGKRKSTCTDVPLSSYTPVLRRLTNYFQAGTSCSTAPTNESSRTSTTNISSCAALSNIFMSIDSSLILKSHEISKGAYFNIKFTFSFLLHVNIFLFFIIAFG